MSVAEGASVADHGVPDHHVEYLAAVMHAAYEEEAIRAGWETNPRSRTSWDRVPPENKQAMRAGVRAMLAVLFRPPDECPTCPAALVDGVCTVLCGPVQRADSR